MVEFPSRAIVMICTMRMTEQMVVKSPSMKMTMRPTLRRVLTCTEARIGMGSKKITQSKKIVTAASP